MTLPAPILFRRGINYCRTKRTIIMKTKDHIIINGYKHISFRSETYLKDELIVKSEQFYTWLNKRRTIREFSDERIPKEVIENLIKSASTSPSGAHKQPWTFCAVSNPELKSQIRKQAEKEEMKNYKSRMSESWKKDLEPLATDMNKSFLETAPWLIVAFKKVYEIGNTGDEHTNYYVNESVGIACGMLITAIHNAGLVTLTHTPSPMSFLSKVLKRPRNERAFLLLPVGYPETPCYVPDLKRKELNEVSQFYD